MNRPDLTETQRRRLQWERRQAAREIGRMYDELVDRHIDPAPFLASVRELFEEQTRLRIVDEHHYHGKGAA